MINEDKVYESL